MSDRNRRVVFVVSTGGHVRGFLDMSDRLKKARFAETSILNFPSDLSAVAPCKLHESSDVEEYVWRGDGVFLRGEIERTQDQAKLPSTFRKIIDSGLRFLGALMTELFIYVVLLFLALANGAARVLRLEGSSKPSLHNEFLRNLFVRAFSFISWLRWLAPPTNTRLIGGPVHFVSRSIFWGIWQRQSEFECLSDFFQTYRPDLIVLPEQNCGYRHEVIIASAQRMGVPVLVMPYTMAGHQEWATAFSERPECQVKGIFKRLVAHAFPEWVLSYGGRRLILPLQWLISCEHLRCVPSIPWVTNSGPDVEVAVDNLFVKEFYDREGVDTRGWRVIGSLAEDRLFRARQERDTIRKNLAHRLGLAADLPIILIGLPPNQFDMGTQEGMEFSDFHSLAEYIVSAVERVAGKHYNIVVNPHPRLKKDEIGFIEDGGVARIADGPIEEILPAAYVYVSVASATIRWAIACEVPVVNFDAYRYHYRDYCEMEGVVDVKTKEQFEQELGTIVHDETHHHRLVEAQVADAERWFQLDGFAEERITALMANLCATSRHIDIHAPADQNARTQVTLFRHAGVYAAANAINSAIPLLLLPLLTRYLTPNEYGLVSMFTVVTAVASAIVGLGTHGAITREFYHRSQKDFAEFVGTCFFILIASAAVLLLLTGAFRHALFDVTGIPEPWAGVPVLIGTGQLLTTIGLVIWQVRGLPLVYGTFQIGASLVNALISLLLIIGLGMGWEGRVIGQAVALSLFAVVIIAFLAREGWIRFSIRREHARQALRYGVPLVFHSLGAVVVAMADKTFIANLVSLAETGLYVVAGQIAMAITLLADSFNRAYAPWLFENLKDGDQAVRRKIVIGTYGYFGAVLLLSGLLVLAVPVLLSVVVGPKFAGATQYIFWLALASAFGGMYYMVTLYIQFSGKTERLAAATLSVGAFNILLCYALVRLEGGIGAAQATALSQLLMFLATWWIAARVIDMDWFFRRPKALTPPRR